MSKDKVKDKDSEELKNALDTEREESVDQDPDLSEQENHIGDELVDEIEQLRDEVGRKNDQILRKVAEFENLRKRTQRERVQLYDDAKINAIQDLLPVYDDLERSLQNAPEGADDSFVDGIKLVYNKFTNALEKMGVERINETGVPFDVNLHDALLRQPAPDENTDSDTVLQVLETGYILGNKVIRHAKVIVSE